jgi:hypothetical protein
MFSIWTKGIADCLYLIPGGGRTRLTSLSVRETEHQPPQKNTVGRERLDLLAECDAVL